MVNLHAFINFSAKYRLTFSIFICSNIKKIPVAKQKNQKCNVEYYNSFVVSKKSSWRKPALIDAVSLERAKEPIESERRRSALKLTRELKVSRMLTIEVSF
jgi:hypothetical protein